MYNASLQDTTRLPLTRELSAKLTEGETFERQSDFSPSVKTFGFATSLIRGRLWHDKNTKSKSTGQAIKLPDRCFAYRNLFYELPAFEVVFFKIFGSLP